jgi:hypothetical protein
MPQIISSRRWEAPVMITLSIRSTTNAATGFMLDSHRAKVFWEPVSPTAPTVQSAPAAPLASAGKMMADQHCWEPPAVTVLAIQVSHQSEAASVGGPAPLGLLKG